MPSPTSTVTTTGIASVASTGSDSTMLDEDPEFYAWLGADDSQQVAME